MTTNIDDDSSVSTSTAITSVDSPYTTQGEDTIEVDTTTAAVTVTLASADAADAGRLLRILDVGDNAETNNITISTEGSETIDPGGESSKTISTDGGSLIFEADGTNWYVVGGSASGYKTTEVSAAYTTQGEDVILVDTSGGAVTVTLATADLSKDGPITIINLDGSNSVTVATESTETIDPNAESSKSITKAGWGVPFSPDGTNWDSGLDAEYETVATDQLNGGVTGSLVVGKIFGERIESQSPSSTGQADFTTGINSDYDTYIFELNAVTPVDDNVNLQLFVSNDGGATFEADASEYTNAAESIDAGGTEANRTDANTASIILTPDGVGSAAGEDGVSGTVKVYHPADSGLKTHFTYRLAFTDDAGSFTAAYGAAEHQTQEAVDGIRFKFTGGNNIESGDIDLYGVMP